MGKGLVTIGIGDDVVVESTDFNEEFTGVVVDIRYETDNTTEIFTVQDGDGDCFDFYVNQIKKV